MMVIQLFAYFAFTAIHDFFRSDTVRAHSWWTS
jgi:hypothetical protein